MQDSLQNPYLEQEVLSASPARLRWLLLDRATGLCGVVNQHWKQGQNELAAQWLLRIREILGELLAGVRSTDQLSRQIADIYVFSLQLLTAAQLERSFAKIEQLQGILEIERETWRLAMDRVVVSAELPSNMESTPFFGPTTSAIQSSPATYQSISLEA